MSNETTFYVGDTVRVLPTEAAPGSGLHANAQVIVEHADATHVRVSGSPYEWFATRFELVKRATPAPLDPSKVKAGDTVTLEDRRSNVHDDSITVDPDWRLTGKVREIHVTHSDSDGTPYAWSVRIGDTPYWMGTAEWTHTLTAHQPAPEPEPEWEMGQVAVVTPHRRDDMTTRAIYGEDGNWHNSYGGFWSGDEVAVRPLVVIDPAAARKALEDNGWGEHETNEVMHELGIEATR